MTADEIARVLVKGLEWTPREDNKQHYGKDTNDRFHYTVLPQFRDNIEGEWVCFLEGIWRTYPTLAAAQAAAEADYRARIAAALNLDLVAQLVSEARAACQWQVKEGRGRFATLEDALTPFREAT